MTRPPASAADQKQPPAAPSAPAPGAAVYEVRTLRTDAEREEAAALVQDSQRWLTLHGLPVPGQADIPALFRDPMTKPAGLFEDGRLLACLIPERDPSLGWGEGPCLFLGYVHTLPDQRDESTRLITLWASDFAARLRLPHVRAEVTTHLGYPVESRADLRLRLINCGWNLTGTGRARDGEQGHRLELPAEHRAGLHALISCQVHLPEPISPDRSSQ